MNKRTAITLVVASLVSSLITWYSSRTYYSNAILGNILVHDNVWTELYNERLRSNGVSKDQIERSQFQAFHDPIWNLNKDQFKTPFVTSKQRMVDIEAAAAITNELKGIDSLRERVNR